MDAFGSGKQALAHAAASGFHVAGAANRIDECCKLCTVNLTTCNAVEYLRSRGHLAPGESASARELSGGVSNTVIHISRSQGDDLVLKQVREQLKVSEPWYCSVDRIWREVDVLRICSTLIHDMSDGCSLQS